MSYIALGEHNIKVWQANVIESDNLPAPGTIVETNKQGIQIATSEHILNITSLQPPGKKAMSAQDFLNARSDWLVKGNTL